jgi:hypothetical protein
VQLDKVVSAQMLWPAAVVARIHRGNRRLGSKWLCQE